MRSFNNLVDNFKTSWAGASEPSDSERPAAPTTAPPPSNSPSSLYISPHNSRANFDTNIARSSENSREHHIGSGTTSPCGDIHHPKWTRLNANLAPYATARMEQRQAQDAHFGEDARKQHGGICYGAGEVWFELQKCTPRSAATHRMNVLTSGPGLQLAWTAQKLYNAVCDEFEAKPQADIDKLQRHGVAHYDTAIMNQSSMFGLSAQTTHGHVFSSRDDFAELGKILAKKPEQFTLPMAMDKPSGEGKRHAINVVSHADKTLTILDSNIGEFNVAVKEFPRFIDGLKEFYATTRDLNFHSVIGIQKMTSANTDGEPALAELAATTPSH